MFYYKTNFSKKNSIFGENSEKPICGKDMTDLRGGEHLATKINRTFFVGIDVLNIFYLTIFSKKNDIFQNKSEKLFFGGRDHS